jgi:alanyl-tRNA synthetase
VVKRVAEPLGAKVDIPDAFDAVVAQKHAKAAVVEEKPAIAVPANLPPTKMNYYEKPRERAFDGKVVWSDGKHVAFEETLFYPEGGGQPCDKGKLTAHGQSVAVVDVQKVGKVVVHVLETPLALKAGEKANGAVDWTRRIAHTRHHTAVHIVNGATRHVLGPQVPP